MNSDVKYMSRAMELARLGLGNVSPNPMVGCVIVHRDRIIGEGYHRRYGGPHAEVHAVNSVKDKQLLHESTVYVTLEPCAHFGKTPPCASLLAQHNVNTVVIANIDPNPLVAGKGIKILEQAGVKIKQGILEQEGFDLNKRFFTSINKQRPYIILKWAETADGFIAKRNFDSKWISNEYSRISVHKWRSEEDAVLVGKNTALHDNPQLSVRDWTGKNPVRIVIDHNMTLDRSLHLFDHQIPTICYNLKEQQEGDMLSFVRLDNEHFLRDLLIDLNKRSVQSVLVEGGAATLNSFIEAGLWDEARVFRSESCFGDGIKSPQLKHASLEGKEDIKGDTLTYFKKIQRGGRP